MRRRPDLVSLLVLAAALTTPASAEPAREPAKDGGKDGGLFDGADFGNRKDPVIITSDALEYDYKANVVVYRGDVIATQGDMKVRGDTLTVTFAGAGDSGRAPGLGRDAGPGEPSLAGPCRQRAARRPPVPGKPGDRCHPGPPAHGGICARAPGRSCGSDPPPHGLLRC